MKAVVKSSGVSEPLTCHKEDHSITIWVVPTEPQWFISQSNKNTGRNSQGPSMSQTNESSSYLTVHWPILLVLCWPAGRVPPVDEVAVYGRPNNAQRRRLERPINEFLSLWGATVTGRVGRAAQWCFWASAPNIDVILLISTLSLLLISLISAWSAAEQQQTTLFFLLSFPVSSYWLPHILRETKKPICFFQPF